MKITAKYLMEEIEKLTTDDKLLIIENTTKSIRAKRTKEMFEVIDAFYNDFGKLAEFNAYLARKD